MYENCPRVRYELISNGLIINPLNVKTNDIEWEKNENIKKHGLCCTRFPVMF